MERDILIKVFVYEDDGFDLKGNVLSDMDCSFLTASEMRQRVFRIGTDSYKTDDEVIKYYIAGMKAAGICVHSYEVFEMPVGITNRRN